MTKEISETTRVKLPVPTIITAVIMLVVWAFSLAGVYYTQESRITELEKWQNEQKKYSLELISYKIDELTSLVKKIDPK